MLPILITVGYLIGSISSAIVACKVFNLPDPRTNGSNNPGTTNVLRIGSKKVAMITLIGDVLKGIIPVLLAKYMDIDLLAMTLVALATILGHIYPIFFRFKGGKGVATLFGSLLALNYLVGFSFAFTWVLVAKVTKISSLAALVSALLTPVYFYLVTKNMQATYMIVIICIWILYTHRNNIKRLYLGSEGQINP